MLHTGQYTVLTHCVSSCFSLTLNTYKVTGQFPWSSLKETDRGGSAEFNVSGGRQINFLKEPFKGMHCSLRLLLLLSHPPAVPSGEDQPHAEVGGRVARAGLPGAQRVLRRARGERTLAEVRPLGEAPIPV